MQEQPEKVFSCQQQKKNHQKQEPTAAHQLRSQRVHLWVSVELRRLEKKMQSFSGPLHTIQLQDKKESQHNPSGQIASIYCYFKMTVIAFYGTLLLLVKNKTKTKDVLIIRIILNKKKNHQNISTLKLRNKIKLLIKWLTLIFGPLLFCHHWW